MAKRSKELPPELAELASYFSPVEWDDMVSKDPTIKILAASSWQDPSNFTTQSSTVSEIADLFPLSNTDTALPSDVNWRELQKACWSSYRTFGPLRAAIDSKSEMTVGAGFSTYSDILEVNEYLKEIIYSSRNELYEQFNGWVIRMLVESELFILFAIGDDGRITIRTLDPNRIGATKTDFGLVTDPDDITATLFYKYKNASTVEWIPDVRFILESPDVIKERLQRLGEKFEKDKISDTTKGKNKSTGSYRRFILHWKNFTGIREVKRDTSSTSTTLEWNNLLINAIKWEIDYRKAISAYTVEIRFLDSPTGKIAWHVWNKMTADQKLATGLTKALSPGSRVYTMPGMQIILHAPQLSTMSGDNQSLFQLSGAGARTPQDLWQGESAGATYASLKASRPPLIAEIENLQSKLSNFLKYKFFRTCMKATIAYGGNFFGIDGVTKYKLLDAYEQEWIEETKIGKPSIKKIKVELCEMVKFAWPVVMLDTNPAETANSSLGSKHTGLYGLGVSAETIARKFGVDDLGREKKKQMLEQEKFGPPVPAVQ